ncbi:MAG TPA: aldo/keto reductase, partial [Opitutus sp.]|nr:aldo/keto reductase [Opitutus sp.]
MTSFPLRPFGQTGERLPAIAMGCGFPGFAGFDRSIETIRRAADLGIRYFDTSPLYCSGASQAIVGAAFAVPTPPHFLATKVGHLKVAGHFRSVEALHVQLRENLRLLRRDSVDLLQLHEADWDNWWSDRADVAPCELFDVEDSFDFAHAPAIQFLREAKAQGLCRHIGITGNNARHLTRLIHEIDGLDSVLIAYNYTPLNITVLDDLLPAARTKGLAVIVAGLFTFVNSIPPGWRTEGTYFGPHADRQLAELKKLQQTCGLSMAELAVRFVATDERLATTLVGACHPHEVEQNVASFHRGKLPADLHAA